MRFSMLIALMLLLSYTNTSSARMIGPLQTGVKIQITHAGTTVIYNWKDYFDEDKDKFRTDIDLKICNFGVCKSVPTPPMIDRFIIDKSGEYVIGLSSRRDGQEQLFVWDRSAGELAKKNMGCGTILSCCSVFDGPYVLWFSTDGAAEAIFENGLIKLRLPEFKELLCDDEIVENDSYDAAVISYFEIEVPIPVK